MSMQTEQNGERIDSMKKALEEITSVYDLANPKGLYSVKFFNRNSGYKNINHMRCSTILNNIEYGGMTKAGTSLKLKILDRLVWGVGRMKKPLLVIIITDGMVSFWLNLIFY